MSGLRLYLLRHGEPASGTGAQWMFYGQHDVDLTPRGRAQAHAQVQALTEPELMVARDVKEMEL